MMNTTAVLIGLFYGILSAVLCSFVSMLTSGLFARPFYRLYSGVLIGICSLMLLSPGLRWLALTSPQVAIIALTLAHYLVIGVFGYGVYRFNSDYLKGLFLERKSAAFFTFGTLANAVVVTIAFLHVAISGTPRWQQLAPGFLTAGNYGPTFVLLAAMVFHTDYHLKRSLGQLRRFSRFTFIGYTVSFIGLGLSLVPYIGNAIGQTRLVAIDSPLLQNFFSAQAMLIAIVLYAWLVWRYESIPPLFLLLLAIIGEYHILISQWVIHSWGVESWALASLPLFAGLIGLDHYFAQWDQRKRSVSDQADAVTETANTLRFAMPFRWVGTLLAISLLAVSLWSRFFGQAAVSPTWIGMTFTTYALFFGAVALFRREPRLIYASGVLAGLAALLSTSAVAGELATSLLAGIVVACSVGVVLGTHVGLKLSWRTPLTDCGLLGAIVVTLLVLWRQLPADGRFYLPVASPHDAVSLACAALAYLATAHQYRSRLPVYGALISSAMMVPAWSAAIGLASTLAAARIERRSGCRSRSIVQEPVRLLGVTRLPGADVMPSLYSGPLSLGAIPLALIGLLTSAISILQRDFSLTALAGAAISALVLGLLATRYRQPLLYVTSLLATYFAAHSIAHVMLFQHWPFGRGIAAHLLLAAGMSLLGGVIAVAYSAWCGAMLRRVAEVKEVTLRANRAYYAGWLFHTVSSAAAVALALVLLTWTSQTSEPGLLLVAAAMISLQFAGAAAVYRTQLGSYLSLSALSLALLIAGDAFELPRWEGAMMAVAGLCAATVSWWTLRRSQVRHDTATGATEPVHWLFPKPILPAQGMALWSEPLMVYAIACTVPAVLASSGLRPDMPWDFQLSSTAPVSYLLAGITLLLCTRMFRQSLLYVIAVGLGFAAVHAAIALRLEPKAIETPAILVHFVVASAASVVCCGVGALIARSLNRSAWSSDGERQTAFLANRDFYAAPLVHVAFAISLLVLVGLAYTVTLEDSDNFQVALGSSTSGLLLAVTFGLSAMIYQSRIATYCALIAGGLATHTAVAMFVPVSLRPDVQALAIAASSVLLGGVSYWITRGEFQDGATFLLQSGLEGTAGSAATRPPRTLQCGSRPQPLVSLDRSLWSLPLAHGSVLLALSGLLLTGQTWSGGYDSSVPTWLKVLPIYLVSIALLIATTTHRTGWLRFGIDSKDLRPWQRRRHAESAERGVLYVLSLLSLGTAIHLTAERVVLAAMPQRIGWSWHLFVAAVLALFGWAVATRLALQIRKRTQSFAAFTKPEPAAPAMAGDRGIESESPLLATPAGSIYSPLLHHVCLATAIGVFGVTGTLTLSSTGQAGPLLASLGLLTLYFGLGADSYRSQLVSYLSILSIGLATLQISAIATGLWPWLGSLAAPATAMLGLALISAATWLAKHQQIRASSQGGRGQTEFYFAAPWPRSTLPLAATSPLLIWLTPLRQLSLLVALVSLVTLGSGAVFVFAGPLHAASVLITCLLLATVLAFAARLEDAPLLTFLAVSLLSIASPALLAMVGQPTTLLGIVLAVLAIVLCVMGFAVERWRRRRSGPTTESFPTAVIRIYEQPLIGCSTALAVIAIGHSLLVSLGDDWLDSLVPLLITSAFGAVTWMLNARSLTLLKRGVWARVMVYLACLAVTGCWLTASTMIWPTPAMLGPNAVLVALLLGAGGLWLVENARLLASKQPAIAASRLTFAEPMSHFAAALAIVTVVLAAFALGWPQHLRQSEGSLPRIDFASLPSVSTTFLVASIVCLMSVRVQQRIGWLYAAVILASFGLLTLIQSRLAWPSANLAIGTLVLMNSLVILARWIRANQLRIGDFLGLHDKRCERPFYQWPLACGAGLVVGQSVYLAMMYLKLLTGSDNLLSVSSGDENWPWFWANLLAAMIFLQAFCLNSRAVYVHLLIVSSVIGLAGIGLSTRWTLTPDVAIALLGLSWGVVAAIINRSAGRRLTGLLRLPLESGQREQGERLLLDWASALVLLALAITIPISWLPTNSLGNPVVALAIATLAALGGGLRWRNVSAITLSVILFPAWLTSAIVITGYQHQILEYGPLLTAVLATVYLGVGHRVHQRRMWIDEDTKAFWAGVSQSFVNLAQLLTGGTLLFAVACIVEGNPALPTVISLGLTCVLWVWIAWNWGKEAYAYAALAGMITTVAYASDSLLQISLTDNSVAAFGVIAISFLLYSFNLLVGRTDNPNLAVFLKPSYYAALALPLALVAAIPFDQPPAAAFALLAAGSFYTTVTHQSQTRWTLYVAAALINVAVYLWMPTASALTGLYQLYVIPAAATVLFFSQLHRKDVQPQVLTTLRLAASGCILAVSTSEVFFTKEPSIVQFVAVLVLSLAGIILGISLRIKPFIYVGISFMIINVVGQLGMQFHREAGVMRAIILIGVGIAVLAMMIFFNVHRERILQQYRRFSVEESWD